MPRALHPATPADDIEARRDWRGTTVAGDVLTPELAAFCQSGLAIAVASVAPPRRPIAAMAIGCRVASDGTVRLLLRQPACAALLEAVAGGAGIAITVSRPHDHRSIQIKGAFARIADPTGDDIEATGMQSRGFAAELVSVGYPPAYSATYAAFAPEELVAVDFVPSAAFVQTPGPGAGAALVP